MIKYLRRTTSGAADLKVLPTSNIGLLFDFYLGPMGGAI
jgi:hypothetical protein